MQVCDVFRPPRGLNLPVFGLHFTHLFLCAEVDVAEEDCLEWVGVEAGEAC